MLVLLQIFNSFMDEQLYVRCKVSPVALRRKLVGVPGRLFGKFSGDLFVGKFSGDLFGRVDLLSPRSELELSTFRLVDAATLHLPLTFFVC